MKSEETLLNKLGSIDFTTLPTSPKEAKQVGSVYYMSKKPCPRGHAFPRYTSTNNCVACQYSYFKKAREENPQRYRQSTNNWKKNNYQHVLADNALRRAGVRRACPSWVCRNELEAFYVRAAELTKETGVLHHVDHIVPLKGKTVSGLHVPNNLQVIPATDNLRKSNTW